MTPRRPAITTTLRDLDACPDATAWVRRYMRKHPRATRAQVWRACPRGDWLLWLAEKAGIDRRVLVLCACDCARLVLHLVPAGEDRPRKAIELAERWANGDASVTVEMLREAAEAAWSAEAEAAAVAWAARAAEAAGGPGAEAAMHRKCADAVRARIGWREVDRALGAKTAA